jgi:hypothetical protein
MTDPVSGKPIRIRPEVMLVMPPKYRQHLRIKHATDVRGGYLVDGTSGNQTSTPAGLQQFNQQTYSSGNPLTADGQGDYEVVKSQLAYNILQINALLGGAGLTAANAAEVVIYLNRQAFAWRQAEPFVSVQAPAGNWLDFNQDIALAIKCREWGVASVKDPRYAVLGYNAGSVWFK